MVTRPNNACTNPSCFWLTKKCRNFCFLRHWLRIIGSGGGAFGSVPKTLCCVILLTNMRCFWRVSENFHLVLLKPEVWVGLASSSRNYLQLVIKAAVGNLSLLASQKLTLQCMAGRTNLPQIISFPLLFMLIKLGNLWNFNQIHSWFSQFVTKPKIRYTVHL